MLESFDPEVDRLIRAERVDIDLRPERNFRSEPVLEALGSKTADLIVEGAPGSRFSGGSESVDTLERLGNERLKRLFGGEEATLQPDSHSQALAAALMGLLKPGDVIMAPVPGAGAAQGLGHESVFWANRYRFVHYGTEKANPVFDHDALARLARRCTPHLIAVSVFPYPRRQDFVFWRTLASEVNARLLVDLGPAAGLVPGGIFPSPVGWADVVIGAFHGLLRGPPGGFLLFKREVSNPVLRGLFPMLQGGSTVNRIAARPVALKEALSAEYTAYAARCVAFAKTLGEALIDRGMALYTGGTDFHYLLLDVRPLGFTGGSAEARLREAGIAARRIPIAFGSGCLHEGDGLLLATHSVTLKGMELGEAPFLADKIYRVLH